MPKLDKQNQRIAGIFGMQDVPDVETDTLDAQGREVETLPVPALTIDRVAGCSDSPDAISNRMQPSA